VALDEEFVWDISAQGLPALVNASNNLAGAYDDIGFDAKDVTTSLRSFAGSTRQSVLGFRRLESDLSILGILSDEQRSILQKINAAVMIGYAGMMLYSSFRTMAKAKAAYELARATAESTAYIASIVNAWRVPVALMASGVVGAFLASEVVEHLPDISNPVERRKAIYDANGKRLAGTRPSEPRGRR
jgi:hypothetical protein